MSRPELYVRPQEVKACNTAPLGFIRLAAEYLRAAALVLAPARNELEEFNQRMSLPAFFLVGHALELALKAFLSARGIPVSQLRGKAYGHNLAALLTEARRRKLGNLVKLSAKELAAVRILDEMYSAKELEYSVTGVRGFPYYSVAHSAASKLCGGLRAHCVSLASNPSIKRTPYSTLRVLPAAPTLKR